MWNSTIKQKKGICTECGDGKDKPLISGMCQTHYWASKRKPLPKATKPLARPTKPIRPRSKKRAAQERVYAKKRERIAQEEHVCAYPGCGRMADEIHHAQGRQGEMLNREEYFVLLCHEHHKWAEEHPKAAKELNLSRNRIANNETDTQTTANR